jgi:hypothetical protein
MKIIPLLQQQAGRYTGTLVADQARFAVNKPLIDSNIILLMKHPFPLLKTKNTFFIMYFLTLIQVKTKLI